MSLTQSREYISRKITFLSVLAMIMVILIHSITMVGAESENPTWNVILQYLFLRSFTYMAVPFFFTVSGYWLVNGHFSYTKKVKTLLIPYFLWSIIGGVALLPLVCANNILGQKPLFARTFLENANILGIIDRLFGICRLGPIGDEPLWYVRNLFLLFLVAPMLKWFIGKLYGRIIFAILCVGFVFGFFHIPINIYLDSLGTGWFLFGMLVANLKLETCKVPIWLLCISGCLWIVCSLIKCAAAANLLKDYVYINNLIPVGGIVFLWGVYDISEWMKSSRMPSALKETFWIYCVHIIFGGYIIGLSLFLLGKTPIATAVIALYAPFVMLGCSVVAGVIVKNMSPRLFNLLTGGRTR